MTRHETLNKHLYHHVIKYEDVEPVTEEKALNDFLAFLKKFMRDDDKKYMIFMHSKDSYVDLLLTKIHVYSLTWEFAEFVEGFCDFTTFLSQLKLDVICKSAKFQDIVDVYKQVIGKTWPKDAVTKDGIVSLSGNCVKKLLSEIEVYLEKNKLKLHKKLFYQMCGF
jgi:hypothetical protein